MSNNLNSALDDSRRIRSMATTSRLAMLDLMKRAERSLCLASIFFGVTIGALISITIFLFVGASYGY